MLNIDKIIYNAIEMCELDIDSMIQDAVAEQLDEICSKENIKSAIKDSIEYTVKVEKAEELEEKINDAISDYVEKAVDEYIS